MLERELRDAVADHEFGAWRMPVERRQRLPHRARPAARARCRSSTVRDYENYIARLRAMPGLRAPADRAHARGPAHRLHAAARRPRRLRRHHPRPRRGRSRARASSTRPSDRFPAGVPRGGARRGCAPPAAPRCATARSPPTARCSTSTGEYLPGAAPPSPPPTCPAAASTTRTSCAASRPSTSRRRRSTSIGLGEVARIRAEMEAVMRKTGLRGRLRRLPRLPAHRPALLREDAGGAAEAGVLDRQAHGRQAAVAVRPPAAPALRRRAGARAPRAQVHRGPLRRGRRSDGTRAGHLLGQHPRPREPAALHARGAHPARGGARPSPADRAAAGAAGPAAVPARVRASARSSRAGGSTPSGSASRPASTPTRTATSAG